VFLLMLAVNWGVMRLLYPASPFVEVSYTFFTQQVGAGNVEEVISQSDVIQGTLRKAATYRADATGESKVLLFRTVRPAFATSNLEQLLSDNRVVINARPLDDGKPGWSESLLYGFGPTLLLVGVFVWLSRKAGAGGAGGLFGLGRSRARRYSAGSEKVTFADVAGIDDAANELVEVVDFLRDPAKYQRLGGTMPKGVLLVGAPGTGKTLLARAVAGQAGVPFFSLSASEFIEMIVGVGAARVRDLFKLARDAAPAIVFIDELDAIGRARGTGSGLGGHDEREQTLNQILTEMDGFDSRVGVIVVAATNRADVLDPALLRPGRFDRRVMVHRPDRPGRAAILKVHTRHVPLAGEVDLSRIAMETPGLVGAELRNLVNEAALLAARKGQDVVHQVDLSEALEKISLGPARRLLLDPVERERTAYHECGHALLGLLVAGSDPVQRVTIVPRGLSLGATYQLPTDDRTNYSESYLRARITSALGGRAAERLVYGGLTTGAESDLRQVAEIARRMVVRWGMSAHLGPMSLSGPDDDAQPPFLQRRSHSEATMELIDEEIRSIVQTSYREAERVLAAHRPQLDALAAALLASESLDQQAILDATGLAAQPRVQTGSALPATVRDAESPPTTQPERSPVPNSSGRAARDGSSGGGPGGMTCGERLLPGPSE
jgi:cell division protease FtsH